VGLLAIAAILVLAAGGYEVRLQREPKPLTARQTVAAAAALTSRGRSSVEFATTVSGLRVSSGTAREQAGGKSARLSMTVADGAVTTVVTEVVEGGQVYVQTRGLAAATGKPWLGVPVADLAADSAVDQLYATCVLPAEVASLLTAAGQLQQAGPAFVAGVPVTRYDGTVTLADAATLPLRVRELLAPELAAVNGPVTFSAWIDAAHRFRKVQTSVTTGGRLTVTTVVFGAGQGPAITVPAASQVAPMPAQSAAASS
jgi:hypothetical protein